MAHLRRSARDPTSSKPILPNQPTLTSNVYVAKTGRHPASVQRVRGEGAGPGTDLRRGGRRGRRFEGGAACLSCEREHGRDALCRASNPAIP